MGNSDGQDEGGHGVCTCFWTNNRSTSLGFPLCEADLRDPEAVHLFIWYNVLVRRIKPTGTGGPAQMEIDAINKGGGQGSDPQGTGKDKCEVCFKPGHAQLMPENWRLTACDHKGFGANCLPK